MSDMLKYIQIQNQDGSYGNQIPLSVDSVNVFMANDDNLEIAMSKKADKTEIQSLQAAVGSPLTAITASAMIDTNKIYVYTGSETGYTNGDWYYWNGTAWIDGGIYNAIALATDTTLTQSGQAADAKVVGDEIEGVRSDLNCIAEATTEQNSETLQFFDKINGLVFENTGMETSGKFISLQNSLVVAMPHAIENGNRYSCNIITDTSYSGTSNWKVGIGNIVPSIDQYATQTSTVAGSGQKGGRIDATTDATYFYLTLTFPSAITQSDINTIVDNLVMRKGDFDTTTYYDFYVLKSNIDDNAIDTSKTWSSEKITEELAKKSNLQYVTPQMFGALADGIHDDTQAIRNALSASDLVILPNGTYKISYNIVVTTGKTLTSASFAFGGASEPYSEAQSVYFNKMVMIDASTAPSPCGIVCYGRDITLQGFKFRGSMQIASDGKHVVPVDESQNPSVGCTGILLATSDIYKAFDSHCCIFRNLIIERCLYAINTANTNYWDNTFENIKIDYCQHGIYSPANNESDFSNYFKNVIILHTLECLNLSDVEATFISCNFGLQDKVYSPINHCINVVASSMLKFIGCNFECDEKRTASDAIISLRSGRHSFDTCMFWARGTATTHFMETSVGTSGIVFTANRYNVYSDNEMSTGNFFVNTGDYAKMQKYGSVVFNGGNENVSGSTYTQFPRPVYGDAELPQLLDLEQGQTMHFRGTTIDKTMLSIGAVLFSETVKKLCIYDGDNIVTTDGTVIT